MTIHTINLPHKHCTHSRGNQAHVFMPLERLVTQRGQKLILTRTGVFVPKRGETPLICPTTTHTCEWQPSTHLHTLGETCHTTGTTVNTNPDWGFLSQNEEKHH